MTSEPADGSTDPQLRRPGTSRIDAHYRALFDALPLPVVISRVPEGTHAYSNPAYARLVHADASHNAEDWSIKARLHPDYVAKAAHDCEAIGSGREPLDDTRYRLVTLDGGIVEVDILSIPTEFEGRRAMFSILLDASEVSGLEHERDAAEERAASIVECIPIGVHFYRLEDDDRLVFTGANPAADAILGFDHAGLVGKDIREAFPSRSLSGVPEAYVRLAREGRERRDRSVMYENDRIASSFDVHAFHTGPGTMAAAFTDITERTRAEREFEDLNTLQSAIFDSMRDGISLLDAGGVHLKVNPALCEMTGFSEEELVGVGPPHPYWPPEESATITSTLDRSARGEDAEFELTFMRKNGERFPVLVTPSVVRDAQGTIVSTFATIRDMTDRKRAEAELLRSQRNLAETERMGGTGSWDYDVASDTASWSENMFRIFDVDPAVPRELVFRTFVDRLVHPDDRAAVVAALQDALAGVRPYDVEYRAIRRDGSARDIHAIAETVPGEDGLATRLLGRVEDVTERKMAEDALRETQDRLQAILDNAPMLVCVLDLDGRFTLVNRALQRLMSPMEDMLGRTRDDFMPPEVAAAHRANDLEVIAQQVPISFEEMNAEPDGEHVYLSTKFPMTDLAGSVAGVCGISLDITDRKRAERELATYQGGLEDLVRERTAELEEASRAKSMFLASMSHELRTPLNSIIGFTGIMLQGLSGDLTGEQRAQLQMVNRSGRQLLGLIGDVLDLEQIEAGRVELDIEEIELAHVVRSIAETVRPMAEDVGLMLQVDVGDAPSHLTTDRRKLEQILLNLLSNALKYTDEGGVALTVATGPAATVSFTVRDTGIGIAEADQERVFDEFRQLPASRGAKHPGSGLGLAISRQLAELLGGHIELESSLGRGSAFTLVLPAR